jgi:ABC-type transporter Mla maintaining outer membrane lipid asymmetry ATPase subunit MlaF
MPARDDTADSPLIELKGVAASSPRRPQVPIVKEIDWQLRPGTYWVVAGLPESGKSAFLVTAAGLNPPLAGEQRLFGTRLDDLEEEKLLEARRRIGFIFDHGGRLFNHLTVAENVALPLAYHHESTSSQINAEVEKILESLELGSVSHNTPGRVNRAWWPRVALARAIVSKPEVLFLDNPLAGLDPRQTRWWRDTLAELFKGHPLLENKPVTLVVACDNLAPFADQPAHFALLREGRFVPIGDQTDLKRSTDPLVREVLTPIFKAE